MSKVKIDVKHNFNLFRVRKRIRRNTPFIINSALGTISEDISNGIVYGRTIDGRRMTPLKPETIKNKRRKGSEKPRTALYDEGIMQKTYITQRARAGNLNGVLSVAKSRSEPIKGYPKGIGQLHHKGSGKIPARPWFGISKTAARKIKSMIRSEVARILGKEWNMK